MHYASTNLNPDYQAIVVDQILSGPWFLELSLTTNTVAQPGLSSRSRVRVYHSIFGAAAATANTDLFIAERFAQTDAGLSPAATATSHHVVRVDDFRVRNAVHELRRVSGLTWENLGDILGVTRRSIHLWANGGSINTPNEKHLRDLLVAFRALDRGTATENRQLLLTPVGDGRSLMDLLRHGEFDQAIAFAGRGAGRPLSIQIEAARQPTSSMRVSVADMLGTDPEPIHVDDGRYLLSRRRITGG